MLLNIFFFWDNLLKDCPKILFILLIKNFKVIINFMIDKRNFPKFRYPNQTPINLDPPRASTVNREYTSYSDSDYEYLIYRTKEISKSFKKTRSKFIDDYGRLDPSDKNRYYVTEDYDTRRLFDADLVRYVEAEQTDSQLTILDLLFLPLKTFSRWVLGFFHIDNPYSQFSLYYLTLFYFYFSEYTWPTLCLYFPFLNYTYTISLFGWSSFLEENLFVCFAVFYLPFFVYLILYWKFYSAKRLLFIFSLFRIFLVAFSIFFFCIFFSISYLQFFFFVPALIFIVYSLSSFPFSDVALGSSDYMEAFRPPVFPSLPAPSKPSVFFLPKYTYSYPWEIFPRHPYPTIKKQSVFTRFPFFNVSDIALHSKRVKSVKLHSYSLNSVFSPVGFLNNFSHIKPLAHDGFLISHFPVGFDYSPWDQYEYYFGAKNTLIDAEAENGMRPSTYVVDFIINEVGVSNIRFFSGENYHLSSFHRYNSIFVNSPWGEDFLGPRAFNRSVRLRMGPYYDLAVWLTLIKPSPSEKTSFSSFSVVPHIFQKKFFAVNSNVNLGFVPKIVRVALDFFYQFLGNLFLRLFLIFNYKFSKHCDLTQTANDFCYILSRSFFRSSVFKEFFRFMIFIDKNKKVLFSTPDLVFKLIYVHSLLGTLYQTISTSPFLHYFFGANLRRIKFCIVKTERVVYNIQNCKIL